MSQAAVKIEDISPVKKKLLFDIPWDDVRQELDAVYQNIGKKAKIKGFRPGKIPRNVLVTYFKGVAEEEVVTNLVNKYYWQELDKNKMIPLSRPDITQDGFKENSSFTFSASFEIEPEFEPDGYKGIELQKENIKVTDDDLSRRMEELRQMFATMEEVKEDRAVIKGDYVTIDFLGSIDGESPKELKADNYVLEIGSQRFIPGFEEQITGMKNGETKAINVAFPADYHEKKFAGKDVVFNVTVKNLKEKKLPEINENFIKNFDRYNSLDDLKNDVRKSLESECTKVANTNLQNKIMDAVLAANSFEAPSSLIEKQIFYMMADTKKRMMSAGMDEKNAAEISYKMHDKYKEEAEKIVRSFLVLKKIAEKEALAIDDMDIDNHVKVMAEKHGRDYEMLKKAYDNEDMQENLRAELLQQKVFDFIEQNAVVKIVEKTGMPVEVEK